MPYKAMLPTLRTNAHEGMKVWASESGNNNQEWGLVWLDEYNSKPKKAIMSALRINEHEDTKVSEVGLILTLSNCIPLFLA